MPPDRRPQQPGPLRRYGQSGTTRAVAASVLGLVMGVLVATQMSADYALLIGWMTAAATFMTWTWITIGPMDATTTAHHAVREDPGRALVDVAVVVAALASLGAVGLLLTGGATGTEKDVTAVMSLISVALAWGTVHTIYTTRYSRLYYGGPDGGIEFNQDDPPTYVDFAYLAFTIGMTFQVSDTDLKTRPIRSTALHHALLSYLFGTVIIAATINVVAGLGK